MARAGLIGLRIRTARADDLPALSDLLEQLRERATLGVRWERAPKRKAAAAFVEILADDRRVFLVAEDEDGAVVGTADLVVVPNPHAGSEADRLRRERGR